jgi:mono/diheme cytochrome c family protein
MMSKIFVLCFALALSLPLGRLHAHAAEPPGHGQGGTERHERAQQDYHGEHRSGGEPHGTHRHDRWVTPPPEYADRRSRRWADLDAIARGQQLYQHSCIICHGRDGKGTGPAAKALPHPPADLTNHFHRPPHHGDAYLFWRVSEGGAVEPFKSMQSAMPPFKTLFSEDQRWDVLAYVHAFFHLGLAKWDPTTPQQVARLQNKPASVTGEGTVIAVVPSNQRLVVEHGAIKGFMDAMTMGYKVEPPSLLEGLAAGDRIRFTIDPEHMAIVTLEKLPE